MPTPRANSFIIGTAVTNTHTHRGVVLFECSLLHTSPRSPPQEGRGTKRVVEAQDAREGRESSQSMDAKSTLTTLQVVAASPSIVGTSPLLADFADGVQLCQVPPSPFCSLPPLTGGEIGVVGCHVLRESMAMMSSIEVGGTRTGKRSGFLSRRATLLSGHTVRSRKRWRRTWWWWRRRRTGSRPPFQGRRQKLNSA